MFEEKLITVGELRELYSQDEFDIEIDTPDGYQKITSWWDKGILPMVVVETADGKRSVCARNHLIQRHDSQWVMAGELHRGDVILSKSGYSLVTLVEESENQECFDFEVDHPNHRYWGDEFSSHNSGKSYIVSGNIVRDALAQDVMVVVIDPEDALKERWMRGLGVDVNHPNLHKEVLSTVDEIAQCIRDITKDYIEAYKETPREKQQKLLFVVDSLGVVQTPAEVEQFERSELKGDKGIKAKTLKMLVANCIRLFAGYEIGLVATNHTYKSQDMYNPDDVISGGCLSAGTLVNLADGSRKKVEDIEIEDVVQTMFGSQPVTHLWRYEKPTFTLEFSDGQLVTCSPEHKFLVASDIGHIWKTADSISIQDEILSM